MGRDRTGGDGTGFFTGCPVPSRDDPGHNHFQFFPMISCFRTFFPVLECTFPVLERTFPVLDRPFLFQNFLSCFSMSFSCFRTSFSCFRTSFFCFRMSFFLFFVFLRKVIVSRDVPGQRGLSRDKGTPGQENFVEIHCIYVNR